MAVHHRKMLALLKISPLVLFLYNIRRGSGQMANPSKKRKAPPPSSKRNAIQKRNGRDALEPLDEEADEEGGIDGVQNYNKENAVNNVDSGMSDSEEDDDDDEGSGVINSLSKKGNGKRKSITHHRASAVNSLLLLNGADTNRTQSESGESGISLEKQEDNYFQFNNGNKDSVNERKTQEVIIRSTVNGNVFRVVKFVTEQDLDFGTKFCQCCLHFLNRPGDDRQYWGSYRKVIGRSLNTKRSTCSVAVKTAFMSKCDEMIFLIDRRNKQTDVSVPILFPLVQQN